MAMLREMRIKAALPAGLVIAFLFHPPSALSFQTGAGPKQNASAPIAIERQVIERTRFGVVQVRTPRSLGSGFLIRLGRFMACITSLHVVEAVLDQQTKRQTVPIWLRTANGQESIAFIWKTNPIHDIAIMLVPEATQQMVPLEIDGSLPGPNRAVFLWGAPYGEALVPLDGFVESVGRGDTSFSPGHSVDTINFRISTAPGNSGGPLLSTEGKVMGVVTRRREREGVATSLGIAVAAGMFWPQMTTYPLPPSAWPPWWPRQ